MHESRTLGAERWVLTFDSSCGRCREISMRVSQASAGRLEVLPLTRADVRTWRRTYFGAAPPHTATLLRVREDSVRGWIGPAIAPVLIRRLGMRSTLRVMIALGKLGEQPMTREVRPSERRMNRAQFLRLCVGAAVGTRLLLTGTAPAFAAASESKVARDWVEANKGALPQQYEAVTSKPMSYRREIFRASSPGVRSQLFVQQLTRYRADHAATLTEPQRAVLDRGIKLFSNTQMFTLQGLTDRDRKAVDAIRNDSISAFEIGKAGALFASLAPPAELAKTIAADAASATDSASARASKKDWDDCTCSNASDYCVGDDLQCDKGDFCDHTNGGCGSGWLYDCDGLCL